jgi:hypothetical protein
LEKPEVPQGGKYVQSPLVAYKPQTSPSSTPIFNNYILLKIVKNHKYSMESKMSTLNMMLIIFYTLAPANHCTNHEFLKQFLNILYQNARAIQINSIK